jgi:hypothetical protein
MTEAAGSKRLVEVLQAIQSLVTTIAIVVGGIWTYNLFILQRQGYPRLKIEHSVREIPLSENRLLLVVDIGHSNLGTVRVSLPAGQVKLYELRPLTLEISEELNAANPSARDQQSDVWELLESREGQWEASPLLIEPGESNQLHYEFVLSSDVRAVQIYSYFKNPTVTSQNIGWNYTTIYQPRHSQEDATAHQKE